MHWLLPNLRGTRVLMYHHVWPELPDRLTVTTEQLEMQFAYLKDQGYQTIFASELVKAIREKRKLPKRTVVLTFDDGYIDQVEFVQPLLKKYSFCANLFLIGRKVMSGDNPENRKDSYLSEENLRNIDPGLFEFGLHGFSHRKLTEMTEREIHEDIVMNQEVFSSMRITTVPVFAYPHGVRPANRIKLRRMKQILQQCGITAAFRIGNGSVGSQVKDYYELKRIDINGFDNLKRFRIKLSKGKLRPF